MPNKKDLNRSQFLSAALQAVSNAETVIMDYYSGGIASELKTDGTPVTVADTEAERIIIETIVRANFPITDSWARNQVTPILPLHTYGLSIR